MQRLDSYVTGFAGFGGVGLLAGVGVLALASSAYEPGAWLLLGWVLTLLSALALLAGATGHAIGLAARGIIAETARPSDGVPAAPTSDAASV
ncbi:hypothetical protein Microterr_25800 [Microbacterium terricola]|uniref:Uncharacterized protein n=1 Tax=Microbacterium terricola TaxID=344163 RepID=A0ABM8E2C8_9MICO|nr:hypothetical protein Microterr_25800 [Microbacterium terricola]